jgi:hypothetical protein
MNVGADDPTTARVACRILRGQARELQSTTKDGHPPLNTPLNSSKCLSDSTALTSVARQYLDQWFPNCGKRTTGGYAKTILVMVENRKRNELK